MQRSESSRKLSTEKLNSLQWVYSLTLTDTIITCVSDEDFAHHVYQYLLEQLAKQKQFEESKDILVTSELVRLDAENNQIYVNTISSHVSKGMLKWILESYLKTDPLRFKDYGVIEFGDAFTIGRILHPSKMDMLSCEICGFFTPYNEELHTHRMTHFGI